jgi:hypothetical protein
MSLGKQMWHWWVIRPWGVLLTGAVTLKVGLWTGPQPLLCLVGGFLFLVGFTEFLPQQSPWYARLRLLILAAFLTAAVGLGIMVWS